MVTGVLTWPHFGCHFLSDVVFAILMDARVVLIHYHALHLAPALPRLSRATQAADLRALNRRSAWPLHNALLPVYGGAVG